MTMPFPSRSWAASSFQTSVESLTRWGLTILPEGRRLIRPSSSLSIRTLPKPIVLESLRIRRSREYGWLSAFRVNEVIAVVIAALAATLSGLMTYYLNKPAFGSLGDYITLFIWGAGVDQTKNFIQNLERTPDKG